MEAADPSRRRTRAKLSHETGMTSRRRSSMSLICEKGGRSFTIRVPSSSVV